MTAQPSKHELAIFRMRVVDGLEPREIALQMGITRKTVNSTIGMVRNKLRARHLPQAAYLAAKAGII